MAGRIASGKPRGGGAARAVVDGVPAQQSAVDTAQPADGVTTQRLDADSAQQSAADKAQQSHTDKAQQSDGDTARGLRAALRAARAALTADERADANARLVLQVGDWADAWMANRLAMGLTHHILAAFWPIGSEPDLRELYTRWAIRDDITLALPVVTAPATPLAFRRWVPDSVMLPGAHGIPEADGESVPVPDLVLVPLLGFTDHADRIGYGGGYYDRTLAEWQSQGHSVITIGVAYACSHIAPGRHMPEPHDIRLKAVATENGWVPAVPVVR